MPAETDTVQQNLDKAAATVETVRKSVDGIVSSIESLTQALHVEFGVSTVIGLVGVWLAYLAFREAKKAKQAATRAAEVYRAQTVTLELSEVIERASSALKLNMQFPEARHSLTSTDARLRRFLTPYAQDPQVREAVLAVFTALSDGNSALDSVRPTPGAVINPDDQSVYLAMEPAFRNIQSQVAALQGMFETRNQGAGEPS